MNSRWKTLAAGTLLVALTIIAFRPGLTSPFTHYDDPLYVTNNIERLSRAGWEGLKLQFDSTRAWNGDFVEYFPLRDAVYWVLYQWVGINPYPYHLTSLGFHLLGSLLTWLFFLQLGLPRMAAFLGALLFAIHPVHIESVVWIAGLKDPMYTMFMLAALCAFASYRTGPATWKYALMLFALVCGSLVKSVMVVTPVLMLGVELLIGERARWSTIAARLAGPFVISGIFFSQVMGVGRANHVILGPHGGSWLSHTVLMVWAQVKYLKQALLPTTYRMVYCFEPPTGLSDLRLWAGMALIAGVVGLAWWWRKDRLKLFLMGFYVVAMLPVSNLVPFPAIMADRYLYAPSIGTCGLLALLAVKLRPQTLLVVTAAVALILTGATASRAWVWQTEELLWEEPDLDPACVVDSAFPAAQAHILRYLTASDREQGLMALERAMVTPGFFNVGKELICTTLIGASRDALDLGVPQRAETWARLATSMCSDKPTAWNAAMAVVIHRKPELAAGAATKAWRLAKSPESEVLMWLTLMELGDVRADAEVLRLAKLEQRLVCEKIAQFASDAPQLAPKLGEANFICASVLQPAPEEKTGGR